MRCRSYKLVRASNRDIESFGWVRFVSDLFHWASQILTDEVDAEQFFVLFNHLSDFGFKHLVGEFDAL